MKEFSATQRDSVRTFLISGQSNRSRMRGPASMKWLSTARMP